MEQHRTCAITYIITKLKESDVYPIHFDLINSVYREMFGRDPTIYNLHALSLRKFDVDGLVESVRFEEPKLDCDVPFSYYLWAKDTDHEYDLENGQVPSKSAMEYIMYEIEKLARIFDIAFVHMSPIRNLLRKYNEFLKETNSRESLEESIFDTDIRSALDEFNALKGVMYIPKVN